MSEDEKWNNFLHFGVQDTDYQELMGLKKKLGIRHFSELARRVIKQGIQKLKEESEGTK